MNEQYISVKPGDLIYYQDVNTYYKTIYISNNIAYLLAVKSGRMTMMVQSIYSISQCVTNGIATISEDKTQYPLVDDSNKTYLRNKAIMDEIGKMYAPTYYDFIEGQSHKQFIKELTEKYNISKATIWRIIRNFLFSGCQYGSLMPLPKVIKVASINGKKRGRKTEYGPGSTYTLDKKGEEIFNSIINEYLTNRTMSLKQAYIMARSRFTEKHITTNRTVNDVIVQETQMPTYRQFYYYFSTHYTKTQSRIKRTSAAEERNNNRILTGHSDDNVRGPGDLVEIDACETDCELVSAIDPTGNAGRPSVLFMIDVTTHLILAVSVDYQKNSYIGLTNLFLNLSEDKVQFAKKYGITVTEQQWPTAVIPNMVRIDRGSDMTSKEFERFCMEQKIEIRFATGATGSLKGVVEQSFHQFETSCAPFLANAGLIEKRHDSKHLKTARLTIEEFTAIVITYVIKHNTSQLENYIPTKEMLKDKLVCTPVNLWNYLPQCGRNILDRDTLLWSAMCQDTATLTRNGIIYNGRIYYEARLVLALDEQIRCLNGKKKHIKIRFDPRDNSAVYIQIDHKRLRIPMSVSGNQKDYIGLSFVADKELQEEDKRIKATGRQQSYEIAAQAAETMNAIVAASEEHSPVIPSNKNVNERNKAEKERLNKQTAIAPRLKSQSVILEETDYTTQAKALVSDNVENETITKSENDKANEGEIDLKTLSEMSEYELNLAMLDS